MRYRRGMARASSLLVVVVLACGPAPDTTSASGGSSEATADLTGTPAPTSTTATPTSSSSSTEPTTGEPVACERPEGDPVDVLVFNRATDVDDRVVVRPADLTCGDGGNLYACNCIEAAADRLVIESPIAVGTVEFTANAGPERIECDLGDDGCSSTLTAGTLVITRADPDCVVGSVAFGPAGAGVFAVSPCT